MCVYLWYMYAFYTHIRIYSCIQTAWQVFLILHTLKEINCFETRITTRRYRYTHPTNSLRMHAYAHTNTATFIYVYGPIHTGFIQSHTAMASWKAAEAAPTLLRAVCRSGVAEPYVSREGWGHLTVRPEHTHTVYPWSIYMSKLYAYCMPNEDTNAFSYINLKSRKDVSRL